MESILATLSFSETECGYQSDTMVASLPIYNPDRPSTETCTSRIAFLALWTKRQLATCADDVLYEIFGPLISKWDGPAANSIPAAQPQFVHWDWFRWYAAQESLYTDHYRSTRSSEVDDSMLQIRHWLSEVTYRCLPTPAAYEMLLKSHPDWFGLPVNGDAEKSVESQEKLYDLLAFQEGAESGERYIYITPGLFYLRKMLELPAYKGDRRLLAQASLDILAFETIARELVNHIEAKMNASRPLLCHQVPNTLSLSISARIPGEGTRTGKPGFGEYTAMMRWGYCASLGVCVRRDQDIDSWNLVLTGLSETIRGRHYAHFKQGVLLQRYLAIFRVRSFHGRIHVSMPKRWRGFSFLVVEVQVLGG